MKRSAGQAGGVGVLHQTRLVLDRAGNTHPDGLQCALRNLGAHLLSQSADGFADGVIFHRSLTVPRGGDAVAIQRPAIGGQQQRFDFSAAQVDADAVWVGLWLHRSAFSKIMQ